MLDSELYDRESHDNATGGPGAGDVTPAPAVPAAVFQPPQVMFQPPAVRPEPGKPESAARSDSAAPARAAQPARAAAPTAARARAGGRPPVAAVAGPPRAAPAGTGRMPRPTRP